MLRLTVAKRHKASVARHHRAPMPSTKVQSGSQLVAQPLSGEIGYNSIYSPCIASTAHVLQQTKSLCFSNLLFLCCSCPQYRRCRGPQVLNPCCNSPLNCGCPWFLDCSQQLSLNCSLYLFKSCIIS